MGWNPSKVIFTDCETTGLDVFRHDAWEISWIAWNDTIEEWNETTRRIYPPNLQDAEPMALVVNQFYQRTKEIVWSSAQAVAEEIAYTFAGKHLIGAIPWFDDRFYQKLLVNHGYQVSWHYHLLDVEAAALGYLAARVELIKNEPLTLPLPWKSDWLAEMLGMDRPEDKERHTSLGDTREVKATFEHIFGAYNDGS